MRVVNDTGLPPVGIGLMCKPPRMGISKTRLASAVGPGQAAALAGAFLADAVAMLQQAAMRSPFELHAFYTPSDAEPELRALLPGAIPLYEQDRRSLGHAMFAALCFMLRRHRDGAIVVGSDLPTLPADHVIRAVACLREIDDGVVVGPADDGGYYLIGIKSERAAPLFEPMAWSTPHVLAETRARAAAHGLAVVELPPWYDVDNEKGLRRLKQELASGAAPPQTARATRAALGL